jgi:hypothetical protein
MFRRQVPHAVNLRSAAISILHSWLHRCESIDLHKNIQTAGQLGFIVTGRAARPDSDDVPLQVHTCIRLHKSRQDPAPRHGTWTLHRNTDPAAGQISRAPLDVPGFAQRASSQRSQSCPCRDCARSHVLEKSPPRGGRIRLAARSRRPSCRKMLARA